MSSSTTNEDVKELNKSQLGDFLRRKNLNLNDNDFKILHDQDVDGSVFVDLIYDQLVKHPFNFSGGKATILSKVIKELKSQSKFCKIVYL